MKNRVALLILVMLLVLAPVAYLIIRNETRLHQTENVYKLKLELYDPHDFIRGRYVQLQFEPTATSEKEYRRGDEIHVTVEKDETGWGYFASASDEVPATNNYFSTQVNYSSEGRVTFSIPFDRYYLNEELAPEAERVFIDWVEDNTDFYAEVVIQDGDAQLKEVYYGDEPLKDAVRKLK